jgi:hypothetical protein
MVGQRVESRTRAPVGAIVWSLWTVLLLVAAAAYGSLHLAIFAALPAAIALALWLTRPRRFVADMTETALDVYEPTISLPYEAITGLTIDGSPTGSQVPLYLHHAGGVIRVPARLRVPSRDLISFIVARIPQSGSRELPPALLTYLQAQEGRFGPDKVFSYRARRNPNVRGRRRAAAVCLAIALAGLAWIVLGTIAVKVTGAVRGNDYIVWIVVGLMVAFLFWLLALAFRLGGRSQGIRKWQESALVVGPAGLALLQGDMRGQLHWDELRNVQYRHKTPWYLLESRGPTRGIVLSVAGADILIADIYDRPLALIYRQIRGNWRRPPADVG